MTDSSDSIEVKQNAGGKGWGFGDITLLIFIIIATFIIVYQSITTINEAPKNEVVSEELCGLFGAVDNQSFENAQFCSLENCTRVTIGLPVETQRCRCPITSKIFYLMCLDSTEHHVYRNASMRNFITDEKILNRMRFDQNEKD